MIAEVMSAYHLGFQEAVDMDVRWFCKIYNRIPVIDARRMLAQMPIVTYPHLLKESDRKKTHSRLVKQARIPKGSSEEETTSAWSRLRGVGVPAKTDSEE